MAEKPKGDFKKKEGGGGGGGPVQGPAAFIIFVGLIGGAIYFASTQGPGLLPSNMGGVPQNTSTTVSNPLWKLFPMFAPKIPGVPAGYAQGDMSLYAKSIRIATVATSTSAVRLIIQGSAPGLTNLGGWLIRTKKGSQLVGAEGNNYTGLLQVTMLPKTADTKHDRILLFDGTGKVVGEYQY